MSRVQNSCLKNRTSTPTTTATSASTYGTTAACLPTSSFYHAQGVIGLDDSDWLRERELVTSYADMRLGGTDASLVVLLGE
jgi:hypothetical protein